MHRQIETLFPIVSRSLLPLNLLEKTGISSFSSCWSGNRFPRANSMEEKGSFEGKRKLSIREYFMKKRPDSHVDSANYNAKSPTDQAEKNLKNIGEIRKDDTSPRIRLSALERRAFNAFLLAQHKESVTAATGAGVPTLGVEKPVTRSILNFRHSSQDYKQINAENDAPTINFDQMRVTNSNQASGRVKKALRLLESAAREGVSAEDILGTIEDIQGSSLPILRRWYTSSAALQKLDSQQRVIFLLRCVSAAILCGELLPIGMPYLMADNGHGTVTSQCSKDTEEQEAGGICGRETFGALSRTQASCLLSAMFLGLLPRRSTKTLNRAVSPTSMMRLLGAPKSSDLSFGKCDAFFSLLLNCFTPVRLCELSPTNSAHEDMAFPGSANLQGFLVFRRISVPDVTTLKKVAFESSTEDEAVSPVVPKFEANANIEENGTCLFHADFANAYIGGGILSHGAVQEEILFCIRPELLCSLYFCPTLGESEAVQIAGARLYANYKGYGHGTKFQPIFPSVPPSALCEGPVVFAIDAMVFRRGQGYDPSQWQWMFVERELRKAVAGFLPLGVNLLRCFPRDAGGQLPLQSVATGKWGCGAFGGHAVLKLLIQQVALSLVDKIASKGPNLRGEGRMGEMPSKREMVFHTFGDVEMEDMVQPIQSAIARMDVASLLNSLEMLCSRIDEAASELEEEEAWGPLEHESGPMELDDEKTAERVLRQLCSSKMADCIPTLVDALSVQGSQCLKND